MTQRKLRQSYLMIIQNVMRGKRIGFPNSKICHCHPLSNWHYRISYTVMANMVAGPPCFCLLFGNEDCKFGLAEAPTCCVHRAGTTFGTCSLSRIIQNPLLLRSSNTQVSAVSLGLSVSLPEAPSNCGSLWPSQD